MLYAPASLLTTVETTPVALLVAVIETPGNTAPEASETVPVSVALLICPNDAVAARHHTSVQKVIFFMLSPKKFEGKRGTSRCYLVPRCSLSDILSIGMKVIETPLDQFVNHNTAEKRTGYRKTRLRNCGL